MMAHFAVACPETPGHENSMRSLAIELQRRGHEISWIGMLDGERRAREADFNSIVYGRHAFPLGYLDELMAELGRKTGLGAARFTIEQYRRVVEVGLQELPSLIRDCGATALIADETMFAARTLSECAKLPWISICSALPLHPDEYLPPAGFSSAYGTSTFHRLRNLAEYSLFRLLTNPIHNVIREFRTRHDLPQYDALNGNASRLATIAQIDRDFDFPRKHVPNWFHYVGSLQKSVARPKIDFPFEQLNGRPLIYASMGTVQNRLYPVFRRISKACEGISAQLVISLGGGGKPTDIGSLPESTIVVEYAPQLELIQRASLVITHAGMNTVTESIAAGVPMLAFPVTNDQPSVAARIAWTGCGEVLPFASVGRIARVVKQLLSNDRYAERARALAESNQRAGGVEKAADIIERTVKRNTTSLESAEQH